MKRKIAVLMTALTIAAALSGCNGLLQGSAVGTVSEFIEEADSASNSNEATAANNFAESDILSSSDTEFDAEKIVDEIAVESYDYSIDYSNAAVFVLKNNSDTHCRLSMSVDFYDGDSIVDTQDDFIEVFSAGTENALAFLVDDKFTNYKYEIKVSEPDDYYFSVNDELSCEVSIATDKAIVSATNNGDETAEYVKCYALFFKNDKLVYTNWNYIGDEDFEIKSGETEKETVSCYENFDSVKVYLDGVGESY